MAHSSKRERAPSSRNRSEDDASSVGYDHAISFRQRCGGAAAACLQSMAPCLPNRTPGVSSGPESSRETNTTVRSVDENEPVESASLRAVIDEANLAAQALQNIGTRFFSVLLLQRLRERLLFMLASFSAVSLGILNLLFKRIDQFLRISQLAAVTDTVLLAYLGRWYILASAKVSMIIKNACYRSMARKAFSTADANGDGRVDATEDGSLDFEEFEKLALLLCESVATRAVTQCLMVFVVSPLLASYLVRYLASKELVVRVAMALLPSKLAAMMGNSRVATTLSTSLLSMVVVPCVLECVDEWTRLRAQRKNARERLRSR